MNDFDDWFDDVESLWSKARPWLWVFVGGAAVIVFFAVIS